MLLTFKIIGRREGKGQHTLASYHFADLGLTKDSHGRINAGRSSERGMSMCLYMCIMH